MKAERRGQMIATQVCLTLSAYVADERILKKTLTIMLIRQTVQMQLVGIFYKLIRELS